MLAVTTIDLLAQVEGLLREVTELQRQALRLREIGSAGKREALTMIAGQVKALLAHADTFRDFLRETQQTVADLQPSSRKAGSN